MKLLHQKSGLSEENPFGNEFLSLRSIEHPHVVRLVGYCHEIQHKYVEYKGKLRFSQYIYSALCFEYLQGGSLDKYLRGKEHLVSDYCFCVSREPILNLNCDSFSTVLVMLKILMTMTGLRVTTS